MAVLDARSTCWVVTDGKAGMESQCVGLAEALGLQPVVKRVKLRAPWRMLSPYLRLGHRFAFAHGSDPLAPPWPDLLIATGRHSIAASLYVRTESARAGRRAVTVQLQNPVISPDHFDLVITPAHDRLRGANVLSTAGALHGVTADKLAREATKLAPVIAHLPRPYIGVLLGGANAAYRFGETEAAALAERLVQAARACGGSLIVTPSRRTGEGNLAILTRALEGVPAFVWSGEGDNPYFGILGIADQIVVTCDSVNMVSEAAASGKPVLVFDLPGGSAKFQRFHEAMRQSGLARPFSGQLAPAGPRAGIDDMAAAAEAVRAAYAAARNSPS
jgi:mitochondrial fission protein ELM1